MKDRRARRYHLNQVKRRKDQCRTHGCLCCCNPRHSWDKQRTPQELLSEQAFREQVLEEKVLDGHWGE